MANDETLPPDEPAKSMPSSPRHARTADPGPKSVSVSGTFDAPTRIGLYRILPGQTLGEGGMGVVYTAEQASPRRLVALKVIRPILGHAALLHRFIKEAEILGRLEHPGIARIYEAGTADAGAGPQPFFAMELIKGPLLLDFVEQKKLSLNQRIELLTQVCDAVQYAHEHGVIHRDLKPSNIMVDPTGQPKILDFGVARAIDSDVQGATMQTDTGQIVGTIQYMSPEQAAGDTRAIDQRSDVYALGIIAYELFSGQVPYDLTGKGLYDAVRIVRDLEPPRLGKLDRKLRGDLETIVGKAMEKDKAKRYASASALADDLRRVLAHKPITARPPSVPYRLSKFLRRNRVAVGAAAALILIALAVSIGVMASARAKRARQLNDLAQRFQNELEGDTWDAARLAKIDAILAQWKALAPADAGAAGDRLARTLDAHLQELIFRPHPDASLIRPQINLLASRDASRARALETALASRLSVGQTAADVKAPFDNLPLLGQAGQFAVDGQVLKFVAPQGFKSRHTSLPTHIDAGDMTTIELTLDASWETLQPTVGLSFTSPGDKPVDDLANDGYVMSIDVQYLDENGQVPTTVQRTMAKARKESGNLLMTIRRGTTVLRSRRLDAAAIPPGALRLSAARQLGKLRFQLNDLPPLEAIDAFPAALKTSGAVGLKLAPEQRIAHLFVQTRALPKDANPLELADSLYAQGKYDEARESYRTAESTSTDANIRQEARFKRGACLIRTSRRDDAIALYDALMREPGTQWPASAGCQLWRLYLEAGRRDDAYAAIDAVSSRFSMQELTDYLSDDMRRMLLGIYVNEFSQFNLLQYPDPRAIERLQQAVGLTELLDTNQAKIYLIRAYESVDDFDRATTAAEELISGDLDLFSWYTTMAIEEYGTLMRMRKTPQAALDRLHKLLLDERGQVRPQFWHLLIERARLLAAMNRFDEAERDVKAYLEGSRGGASYAYHGIASLMLGFLREQRGDAAGALAAWRGGLMKDFHTRNGSTLNRGGSQLTDTFGGMEGTTAIAVACLSNAATDAEIEALTQDIAKKATNTSNFAAVQSGALRVPPAVVRRSFGDPRGRAWTRQFAFRELPAPQISRALFANIIREYLREGALGPGQISIRQERILGAAAGGLINLYVHNQLQPMQMVQFALAWKGTTSAMGWAGFKTALGDETRAAVACLMAMRYERLGLKPAAQQILREALADAGDADTKHFAQLALGEVQADALDAATQPARVVAAATAPATTQVASDAPQPPSVPRPILPAPVVKPATVALGIDDLNRKAWLLRRDGKLAEAAEMRRQAIELADKSLAIGDPKLAKYHADYSDLLLELGRLDEAETMWKAFEARLPGDALQSKQAVQHALEQIARLRKSPTTVAATAPAPTVVSKPATRPAGDLDFVTRLINLKQYREAEQQVLEFLVVAYQANDRDKISRALPELGRVYRAWGKAERADEIAKLATVDATPAANGWSCPRLDISNRLAYALRLQKKLDEALAIRRDVVAKAKEAFGEKDDRTLRFQIDLVDLLIEMKLFDEAEKELLGAEKVAGDANSDPQAATVRRALARLYDLWNKPDKAAEYRKPAK
jgi:tetratricopeptide (TPR) repeat protein